jgi:hypothetical protein
MPRASERTDTYPFLSSTQHGEKQRICDTERNSPCEKLDVEPESGGCDGRASELRSHRHRRAPCACRRSRPPRQTLQQTGEGRSSVCHLRAQRSRCVAATPARLHLPATARSSACQQASTRPSIEIMLCCKQIYVSTVLTYVSNVLF